MSERDITRQSLGGASDDRTDRDRVDRLTDEEIERAVAEDPDAPELLDEAWFEAADWVEPDQGKSYVLRPYYARSRWSHVGPKSAIAALSKAKHELEQVLGKLDEGGVDTKELRQSIKRLEERYHELARKSR